MTKQVPQIALFLFSILAMFATFLPTAMATDCECEPTPEVIEVAQPEAETQAPTFTPKAVYLDDADECAVAADTDCVDVYVCDVGSVDYNDRVAGLSSEPTCDIVRRGMARPDTGITLPNAPTPPADPEETPVVAPACTAPICFTG